MRFSNITSLMRVGTLVIVMAILLAPMTVFAWGDNFGYNPETGKNGRSSYTTEEINEGILGNRIVLNSISDSMPVGDGINGGSEKNFVAARECILLEDGSWEGVTENTKWYGNDITVEDGKYYIIRTYVHNNNPNGENAVAEDVHVSFSIPNEYDEENKQIQVNGYIDSSNATPSEYWDYINLISETPFHLEFINNSGLLENNGIGLGGLILSDDVVKAKSGGVLIGYDALDGRIPGCYQYDNFVTIKVRAVFDYEYTVEQKVRLADSDNDWEDAIEAKVGDKVEFRIGYKNTSDKQQDGVTIKDILPSNLKYVDGTTVLKNSTHPNGATAAHDYLVKEGTKIGSYGSGANAYIRFKAEVVDDNLKTGANTLTNWSQAGVGLKTIQDHASVIVYKNAAWFPIVTTILVVLIVLCFIIIVVLLLYKWKIKKI
ncbi:hypothetical protein [Sporofaciens sp. JLR.KK001]|jgi:uncharacterized repeat protein (TIGR01451 family)|uniref:hypothetical protein n=1 Tax=Sporofaciens sp. JLR.KK001 TaxID=3112621 RepID=UPI002FF304E5